MAGAPVGQVREHPLLPQGVISPTSSLSEQGAVHHIVHRTLASYLRGDTRQVHIPPTLKGADGLRLVLHEELLLLVLLTTTIKVWILDSSSHFIYSLFYC